MKDVINVIGKADQGLFITINKLQTRWQNKCFSLITNFGGVSFQTCLVLFLILLPSTRYTGYKLGLIQIIVTLNIQILKYLFARTRPYKALTNINPLKTEKDYSFPSGHSASAFSTALALSAFIPSISILGFILAAFTGYSRIYIGVHYPSDVIAGSLIGLGITTILI